MQLHDGYRASSVASRLLNGKKQGMAIYHPLRANLQTGLLCILSSFSVAEWRIIILCEQTRNYVRSRVSINSGEISCICIRICLISCTSTCAAQDSKQTRLCLASARGHARCDWLGLSVHCLSGTHLRAIFSKGTTQRKGGLAGVEIEGRL